MEQKQKQKKGNLGIFISVVMAAIVVVFSTGQLLFINGSIRSELKKSTNEEYAEFSRAYSDLLKATLEKYFTGLDFYVKSEPVSQNGSTEQIVNWLHKNEANRDKSLYDYVAYVNENGDFYSDTGSKTSVRDRDYFKAIMQNGSKYYIDDPVASKTTGISVIHICKPVVKNGKNTGFFCGVVREDNLKSLVTAINLGEKGNATLFSGSGSLIVTSGNTQAYKTGLSLVNKEDPSALSAMKKIFTEKTQKIISVKGADNSKKTIFSSPVEYTNWTLMLVMSEKAINKTARNIVLELAICGVIITIFIVLFSALIIFKNIKPISLVEKTVRGIATGDADLTKRIEIKSNNEIGRVVDGFNLFSEKLQNIISALKKSKEQLVSAGEILETSTEDSMSAISQISGNILSMSSQVTTQTNSVHQTAGAVNQIAANIESLNRMIESQASAVTQASAAVEEMIGNINSVNNSVQKMGQSFEELEKKASAGVQKQNDVNSRIDEIEKESQMLQEANAVISGIAEQTNLLAMNAAIEAAHAGEAGKGFSVVADEIRKLSEDSSSQSQTIGKQLSKIIESINAIVNASQSATDAFDEVSNGINSTTNLVREITNAMLEQNAGSKQIVEALNSMNDTSNEVKTAALEMAEGNKAILAEVKNLQDATFSIKDGMESMSQGAKKINETGTSLSELSHKIYDSIKDIGSQVDKFKV